MAQFKERIIISIVGNTNVGKSTLFNLITGQKNKSIVDNTAGTTADTVKSVMEIHGIGAVKLIDTAGVDEISVLGDKKREKTLRAIDNSDLVLFVVKNGTKKLTSNELEIVNYIKSNNKQCLVIYNNFGSSPKHTDLLDYKSLIVNCNDFSEQLEVTEFIKNNFTYRKLNVDFLPNIDMLNKYVLLIIPLDEESPELRLLRPQSMSIERLLKIGAIPVIHKPDLTKLRNKDEQEVNTFKKIIKDLRDLSLVITDSQAFDCICEYIPKQVKFTSFSIMMTNFMTNGNILNFIDGVKQLDNLQDNDNVLIVEACKHDRKCNDIATAQLPAIIKKYTNKNVNVDFNFGESFLKDEELKKYKLVIMCGGCMIDKQEYNTRLRSMDKMGVNYTNYGLVFSYVKNKELLEKCVEMF